MKQARHNSRRALPASDAFPSQQLFVLALCRICEPIAFMSIFPYVYYMVASFDIASNEKSIALYAGMVTSSYAFAEFSTSIMWGRISDKYGRKPVLLMGLFGTGLSMLVFGFAPNLWTALIARALGGLLNGNIGVINTTVAEIVTQESHQARAFSIMPGIWCIGSIIGSGLGGILADPVRNYPGHFAADSVFAKFPYLLPNLVCCCVVLFSVTVGLLFLEETHEDKRQRRDFGLELGARLLNLRAVFRGEENFDEKDAMMKGEYRILRDFDDERESSDNSSIGSSPTLLPLLDTTEQSVTIEPRLLEAGVERNHFSPSLTAAFTRQVITVIVSYGLLAFHTISAEQLLPVMLSLPLSAEPIHLPLFFTGGFELPTKTIGIILSGQGLVQTISLLVIFPMVSKKIGSVATYRIAVLTYPLFYILVPYLSVLPQTIRMPALCVIIVWKVTAQALALPPIQILLANSAPSKRVLGTLNGTAASSASLCRGFGPTLSGLIQSAGLSFGCLGLPWWTSSAIATIAAILCLSITETRMQTASKAIPPLDDPSRLDLALEDDTKQADFASH